MGSSSGATSLKLHGIYSRQRCIALMLVSSRQSSIPMAAVVLSEHTTWRQSMVSDGHSPSDFLFMMELKCNFCIIWSDKFFFYIKSFQEGFFFSFSPSGRKQFSIL